MINTKQLKINRLFKRQGAKIPHDNESLEEEIQHLEQTLRDKQNELFLMQRNSLKHKLAAAAKKNEPFVRPEKIIAKNNIEHLERNMELMTMLTGMEVKSYKANDNCVIVYHMQHKSDHAVQHGLRIEMESGANEVERISMPFGFNFTSVVEYFDNIMTPECLGSLRKALVAYYERIQQFEKLKAMLSIEAEMFKVMDGSHMEITFRIQSAVDEEEEPFDVVMLLDYRVYDIRPKHYRFIVDASDAEMESLMAQCSVFKRLPLSRAFKECFCQGTGTFEFVQQVGLPEDRPTKRPKKTKPTKYNDKNDDTFVPDDDEDSTDDDGRQMRKIYGRGG